MPTAIQANRAGKKGNWPNGAIISSAVGGLGQFLSGIARADQLQELGVVDRDVVEARRVRVHHRAAIHPEIQEVAPDQEAGLVAGNGSVQLLVAR